MSERKDKYDVRYDSTTGKSGEKTRQFYKLLLPSVPGPCRNSTLPNYSQTVPALSTSTTSICCLHQKPSFLKTDTTSTESPSGITTNKTNCDTLPNVGLPSVYPNKLVFQKLTNEVQPVKQVNAIEKQLIKMLYKHYYSYDLLDDREFQEFLRLLQPTYTLPSREILTNDLIPRLFNETRETIMNELSHTTAVCLTLERCSATIYAITVHYISSSLKLRSNTLECFEINIKHTSNDIADKLMHIVKDWKITSKIIGVVNDYDNSIVKAINLCNWKSIPCYAHLLKLVVKSGIKVIENIVKKFKNIVKYLIQHGDVRAEFTFNQKDINFSGLILDEDVSIRWNSTLEMLNLILGNQELIKSTLSASSEMNFNTDYLNWNVIDDAKNLLSSFEEARKDISEDNTINISKVSILSQMLINRIERYLEEPHCPKEIENMGKRLIENLHKKFGAVEKEKLIAQAIILDPRFKKQGFVNEKDFNNACESLILNFDVLEDTIENTITTVIEKYKSNSSGSLWNEFDESTSKLRIKNEQCITTNRELKDYLAEPLLARELDPLEWWEEKKLDYPNLYEVMLKRLCIRASSVSYSKLFSKAGVMCNEKACKLTCSELSKILFLNSTL
ncbi:zinc finger BED domain-containing protein RICESLEEPER 1-like isoform X2 [Centruroides sculpturatus]|nr:zinc finger BED domain-containing protein RICESLEEPER 1-like isoform X2 [Centruroides sculpturatus]